MFLITGAAGFIGSAFIKHLNENKINDIIAVDEFGNQDKWKNLRNKNFIRFYDKNDFLEIIKTGKLKQKINYIIHFGACSDTTETDMNYLYKNNVEYSIALLNFALNNDIRFIYASSAAVYGNGNFGFNDDEKLNCQLKPLNKYAYSKWLFDNYVILNGYENKVTGLRFFNVFGPNEYHKEHMSSIIFKAYNQINQTGKIKLFKSNLTGLDHGEQKRDFIYVKDVLKVTHFFTTNNKCGIYNVGTGDANSFNSLAIHVFNAMSKEYNVEYIDMPLQLNEKYQNYTCADISKLRKADYNDDFTDFKTGVYEYVKKYLKCDDIYY